MSGKSRSVTIRLQDGHLLRVLLAEVGDVRPDHVEQLRDDGADAGEVAGASFGSFEDVGQAVDADGGREALGVHGVG